MILMYHHVAPQEAIPKKPSHEEGWECTISPVRFEFQLRQIIRRGYKFLTLNKMVRDIQETGSEPVKTVAITFDDGWADNYQYAFPILRKLHLTATFFVTTDHIHKGIDDPQKMTVSQLLELLEAGMEVGGHTRTHPASPSLTRISELKAIDEIAGCKADIESALSIPVKLFAYPGGDFNSSIVQIVREAGYIAACSIIGFGQNDISSLFWLYRDVLTEEKNNLHDLFIFSPLARRLVFLRNKRLLQRKFD